MPNAARGLKILVAGVAPAPPAGCAGGLEVPGPRPGPESWPGAPALEALPAVTGELDAAGESAVEEVAVVGALVVGNGVVVVGRGGVVVG